jgi:hypothetical protein
MIDSDRKSAREVLDNRRKHPKASHKIHYANHYCRRSNLVMMHTRGNRCSVRASPRESLVSTTAALLVVRASFSVVWSCEECAQPIEFIGSASTQPIKPIRDDAVVGTAHLRCPVGAHDARVELIVQMHGEHA